MKRGLLLLVLVAGCGGGDDMAGGDGGSCDLAPDPTCEVGSAIPLNDWRVALIGEWQVDLQAVESNAAGETPLTCYQPSAPMLVCFEDGRTRLKLDCGVQEIGLRSLTKTSTDESVGLGSFSETCDAHVRACNPTLHVDGEDILAGGGGYIAFSSCENCPPADTFLLTTGGQKLSATCPDFP